MPVPPKPNGLPFKVIKQTWTESERGWGQRPDGYSLHLSVGDMEQFNKEYWDSQPKTATVPDEYSRPDVNPKEISVGYTTYKELKASKHGIRRW